MPVFADCYSWAVKFPQRRILYTPAWVGWVEACCGPRGVRGQGVSLFRVFVDFDLSMEGRGLTPYSTEFGIKV